MGGISLNSNIASLKAIRKLDQASNNLTSSFERLSSGQRINRASDDAAGLAIATSLRTDARVYNQGIRNINDGISLLNIADGALEQLSTIGIRLKELAAQSASGTLGNSQRTAIDTEGRALVDEYNRIIQTTSFNGIRPLHAEFDTLSIQTGYGTDAIIRTDIGSELARTTGNGTFATQVTIASPTGSNQIAITTDLNGDGKLDILSLNDNAVQVFHGNGDGTFIAPRSYTIGVANIGNSGDNVYNDINNDGVKDLVVTAYATYNQVFILMGNSNGTFKAPVTTYRTSHNQAAQITSGDINGDGKVDLITALNGFSAIDILLGNGDGTFKAPTSVGVGAGNGAVKVGYINNDSILDVVAVGYTSNDRVLYGNGDGTFRQGQNLSITGGNSGTLEFVDVNGDDYLDAVNASFSSSTIGVHIANGDGTFKAAITYTHPSGASNTGRDIEAVDINGDGYTDIALTGTNPTVIFMANSNGTFKVGSTAYGYGSQLSSGDFNQDGALDLLGNNGSSFFIANGNTREIAEILYVDLSTRSGALTALGTVDSHLQRIQLERGLIGSGLQRLQVGSAATATASTQFKAAESRISDIDVASETSKLTASNILQQAASAVLAQANTQVSLALSLLR